MTEPMLQIIVALADANRLAIVDLLKRGPLTVGEIAERLSLNQPQVSKHLRTLHDAEIVQVKPLGNRRIYHLRLETFFKLTAWSRSFEQQVEERMLRLESYLLELQEKPTEGVTDDD
ncbi:metalloregulator ArsR/SmtB family transcription factor [Exiguobacterium sp. H66]|uniref:ArsR/SmtB family transcription factor n=1 Tax=Exiguobacterium sp. H66 TaxID=2751208 RepID=UPI001BE66DC5|nr:metalloregulator ArsR/SmtB family transcription factor [Exiguobacterium sp. H66]